MSNIRLYINDQEADIDQNDVDVTLTYSVESIKPGTIKGAHSKRTIKLPATKGNTAIFEHIEDPGSLATTAYKFLPARLESAGLPILTGKAKLDGADVTATSNGFEASRYRVSLIGNNADWLTDVGNQLVRDLGWENITVSISEIEENRDPDTNEYAWVLMKWKEWIGAERVQHNEFSPAIFIWQVLDKAFASRGYELNSIFKQEPFNRLIIPIGLNLDADFFKNFVDLRASTTAPITLTDASCLTGEYQLGFPDESTDPNFDNGGNYTGGVYTAPITALYEIIYELNVEAIVSLCDPMGGTQFELHIRVNGSAVSIYALADGHDWNVLFELNSPIVFEHIMDLNQGDTVELYLIYGNMDVYFVHSGFVSILAEKESFELGEVYDLGLLIPSSWYVKNVIEDLTFIFNLAWETDVAGQQVYAYPKDSYYTTYRADASGAITTSGYGGFFRNTNQYDLVGRELYGNELTIIDGYKQRTVHAWSTDDDTTNKEEERRGVNIYSGGYEFPSDRFDDGVDFLYTGFFAKTIHINDVEISSGGMFGVQIPLKFGDDYNATSAADPNYYLAPSLLYYGGRRAGLDGYVKLYNTTTSATSAFDYPIAFMTNYSDTSAGDFSLSFSDEVTNYSGTVPGLFKTFYMQEYKRREIGKIFTCKTMWDQGDISSLTFRNKPKIGSSNFILQELEYNPKSNRPGKTVLLYDERPNVTDLDKLINTVTLAGAGGQPGTVTGSGSGLVGAGGSTINIYQTRSEFLVHQSNELVLTGASGITKVNAANIYVFQNGQLLIYSQYTVSGTTVTIDVNTHYNDANYIVIVNGVNKG